jgi:hypothetical protein
MILMWTYVYIYIHIYTMYMSYISYIYTMYMYVYVMSVKTPFSFAAQASSHQPTFWAPLLRRQRHGAPAEKRTSTALQLEILRSNRLSNGVHKSAHVAPVRDDSDTKTDQRSPKHPIPHVDRLFSVCIPRKADFSCWLWDVPFIAFFDLDVLVS